MLNLNRQGVLCKIAYGWQFASMPEQTNLCNFFWRVVLSFFFVWPFIFVTRVIGYLVRIIGAPIAFILFGHRPAGLDWRIHHLENTILFPFVPIKCWPKPKWWGERHFMLFEPLIGLVLVAMIIYILYEFFWVFLIHYVLIEQVYSSRAGRVSFWSVVVLIVIGVIYAITRKTEVWQMTKAYAIGIKKRYCPIVMLK